MDATWTTLASLVMSAAPALLLLGLVVTRAPRPRLGAGTVAVSLGGGMVAGMAGFFSFTALESLPGYEALFLGTTPERYASTAFLLAVVGPIEETLKIVAVSLTVLRVGAVRRLPDALTHASAAALGFAMVENWYAMWATGGPDFGRAFVIPFLHLLFSSLSGWGLGRSLETGRRWPLWVGLGLAAAYHGLYDVLQLRGGLWHLATLPVVALLWFFLTETMARSRKAEPVAEAPRASPSPGNLPARTS
jgi:RsiW-degrading membrane proteinase PrsW (M82 family)